MRNSLAASLGERGYPGCHWRASRQWHPERFYVPGGEFTGFTGQVSAYARNPLCQGVGGGKGLARQRHGGHGRRTRCRHPEVRLRGAHRDGWVRGDRRAAHGRHPRPAHQDARGPRAGPAGRAGWHDDPHRRRGAGGRRSPAADRRRRHQRGSRSHAGRREVSLGQHGADDPWDRGRSQGAAPWSSGYRDEHDHLPSGHVRADGDPQPDALAAAGRRPRAGDPHPLPVRMAGGGHQHRAEGAADPHGQQLGSTR